MTAQQDHGVDDGATGAHALDAEEALRADIYDFLASLLARAPDRAALAKAAALEGDDSDFGGQIRALAERARKAKPEAVDREFHNLFIGLGRGELLPNASYYMTGFLNEKPLAKLRRDMLRHRMERAANVFEPEDNIASLCEMMAGLIRGRFSAPADLETQREFFNTHLAPWAAHFFRDLETAKTADFYKPLGAIGRMFIEIEREAFRMEDGAPSGALRQ